MKSLEDPAVSCEGVVASAAERNRAGRYAESLALVDRALERDPADPRLLVARASTLFESGRVIEAREALLQARAAGAPNEEVALNLGWCHAAAGMRSETLQCMSTAVAHDPASIAARFGLATALYNVGRRNEAREHLSFVLARDPQHVQSLMQLGEIELAANDPAAAEALFRRVIDAQPHDPAGWLTLGIALDRQGRSEEAVAAVETAQRLEEQSRVDIENFVNLAVIYADVGRFDEARQILEANLPQKPGPRAHTAYAYLLLRMGCLREGWKHYEFRLMQHGILDRIPYGKPPWTGQPIQGRKILLWREQGIGDAIQFVRYAPMLKALGATVWLQIGPAIRDLATSFLGVDRVFADGEPVPGFDYYVHLASLPGLFSTSLETIPADVPYVSPSGELLAKWKRRLRSASGLKVGLVWAGHPNHLRDWERSMALRTLVPLTGVVGVAWFSLQKGPASAELANVAAGIEDLSPELTDFSETAAALHHMDLVVSVDTSVAHLAGAMARPTWLLLPKGCDFRWMEDRTDSPWYPTMRLFRQTRRGDWGNVIEQVAVELRRLVSDGPSEAKGRVVQGARGSADSVLASIPTTVRSSGSEFANTSVAQTRYGVVQYVMDDHWVGQSVRWYGEYLQPELQALLALLKPGATVLEASAGVGIHAVAIASTIGERGHLMLYESRLLHRRLLAQNLSSNGATNVTLMRPALALPHSGITEAQPAGHIDGLRLQKFDALKINRPASPREILNGARESIWRSRPVIMLCELQESEVSDIASFVRDFGYRCAARVGSPFNPGNFYRRQEDVFRGQKATTLLGVPEERDIGVDAEGFRDIS